MADPVPNLLALRRDLQKPKQSPISVTRFGEISPLLHKLKVLGNIWKDYWVFGEILNLFLQTSYAIGHILIVANDQI